MSGIVKRSGQATEAEASVVVGSWGYNTKDVDVKEGLNCPPNVNKNNWDKGAAAPHANAGDSFSVTKINKNKIRVKRTDSRGGWGLNLQFRCKVAGSGHDDGMFSENAMPVGACKAGEDLNRCTGGENHWGNFNWKNGLCGKGQKVAFAVVCAGPKAQAAFRKRASCLDEGGPCAAGEEFVEGRITKDDQEKITGSSSVSTKGSVEDCSEFCRETPNYERGNYSPADHSYVRL